MKIITNPSRNNWESITQRPIIKRQQLDETIATIFDGVKQQGDEALLRFTETFDNVTLEDFKVTAAEIKAATAALPQALKDAINLAKNNIETFHASQKSQPEKIQTSPGVWCWQESRPIEKVGLYIPGGTAPLFSTVLMLGVPAKIAGCKEIILCTPPDENGEIAPAILYTCGLVGINKIFKVGGAQAVAAMTIGTASIPKVYKILGPGNQYVTAAKEMATRWGVAIDMPAGPSELMVIADDSAVPGFVAADLLSQAEHGTDSQVMCICKNEKLATAIATEVQKQLATLPRKAIAEKSIEYSKLVLLENDNDCIDFCNLYAPEHLILAVENQNFYIENLQNAGSVFLGNYSPESAGDYASGTNHTLPTNGFAKSYSGVNLDSFVKKISFQEISQKGIREIGPAIEQLAAAEQLQAHKRAVSIRLKYLAEKALATEVNADQS